MLSKNYQQRLEKWRNNQPTEEVELNKIDIVYKVHKNAKSINLKGNLNKKILGHKSKAVVMKKSNGRYTLLFGMADLVVLKLLNLDTHKLIVTDLNRNEIEKELENYL